MTASPKRWEGRRFSFSVADWRLSSGRGTAGGWWSRCWRLISRSRQPLRFVPGLPELTVGAQSCQEAADTGGQVWAAGRGRRQGRRQGRRRLPKACSLEVPSWREAAVRVGNGAPLIALARGCWLKGWSPGPGGCARDRSFQKHSFEGKRCSRDLSELRGVPQRDARAPCACGLFSPLRSSTQLPCISGVLLVLLLGTCRGQFGDRCVPRRAGRADQWGDQPARVTGDESHQGWYPRAAGQRRSRAAQQGSWEGQRLRGGMEHGFWLLTPL